MHQVVVWTERKGWLSPDVYPEIHRHFTISHLAPSDSFSKAEALLIVDDGVLRKHSDRVRAVARRSVPAALPVIAVSNGASEGAQANDDLLFDVLPEAPTERQLLRALRNASYLLESERRLRESREAAEQNARELEEINAIGIALSAERDHNRLLNLILSKGREITKADAGSLFLVENIDMPIGPEDRTGNQARVQSSWLRFRLAQNDSREFSFEEEVLEITPASIAGYVAQTGETLNIKDAYQLPPDRPFTINRSFDEATGYRTCSMLVVPMRNHVGETIGVLQLINKKRDRGVRLATAESFEQDVLPFTSLDEQLVRSLASQAAVSVENNSLYKRIEKLLDEFVYASVRAIESRDPTTEGHSWRVARMTKELARVTNRVQAGPYRDLRLTEDEIRELEYAALLHDFGKVGVREKVLVKATKLYHGELSLVRERFKTIKRTVEAGLLRRMLDRLLRRGAPPSREEIEALNAALQEEWARVDEALENVEAANQPTVTDFSDFLNRLEEIGRRTYTDVDGQERRFLVPVELLSLSIPRGTLTEAERDQIRDHVKLTYDWLANIPWTRELQNIPRLARAHHEKLDGSGYPYGLKGTEIPVQTRMMTIADIFDALAAQDRPYKPAVRPARALDILRAEAKQGQLDQTLLELFIAAKVYELAKED